MKNNFLSPEFFLATNTSEGFFSVFNTLYDPKKGWFCYILKGGPGTGKSTIMKKVAEVALKKGITAELIHCSSDPDSLDAVILPELKIAVADGTSPHVLDPIYPGTSDTIINLGDAWNKKILLKSKDKIQSLCEENSFYHAQSKRYLKAFGCAFKESANTLKESINYDSLNLYCERLSKKLFKKTKIKSKNYCENIKFISAITPKGYVFFNNTLIGMSKKLFLIEDDFGIIGSYILKKIKSYALDSAYNVISCPSPFAPSEIYSALFIPDMEIGFAIKNSKELLHMPENLIFKKITTKRFLIKEKISAQKNLLKFNKKFCRETLNESIKNLNKALDIHNDLEKIYIKSMNYSKINKITDKLIFAIDLEAYPNQYKS